MRESDGRCSYDHLVAVAAREEGVVLDLACGDGYLLERLAEVCTAMLLGLDMSPHELAAAHERLGTRATLHLGHATALPMPDQSVDLVTCHMALMLMGELDAVLTEVVRVLRPGGAFAAVVGRRELCPVYDAFLKPLFALLEEEALPPLILGDARTRREEGLRALFSGEAWSEALNIEPLTVSVTGPPDEIWPLVASMYDPARLSDAGRAALEARAREAWVPLQDRAGALTLRMGLWCVTARRSGP